MLSKIPCFQHFFFSICWNVTSCFLFVLQDMDDDAILIGAQFCSDSFSSISLDAVKNGVSYSLYARLDMIISVLFFFISF